MADAVFQPDEGEIPASLGYARVFGKQHRPLATRDGHICLIANTDGQWKRLFQQLGCPELSEDARFAGIGQRMANVEALYGIVEDKLQDRDSAEWLERLNDADIPAGPANGLGELREDPHLARRAFFQEFAHPTEGRLLMPAVPLQFSETPGDIRSGPPRLVSTPTPCWHPSDTRRPRSV